MNSIDCLGLVVFVVSVVFLCCIMLFCGHFLGNRSNSCNRNVPFESGIASVGNARIRFSIKFYLIAMIFVIFDVEGIYIYMVNFSTRDRLDRIGYNYNVYFCFVSKFDIFGTCWRI